MSNISAKCKTITIGFFIFLLVSISLFLASSPATAALGVTCSDRSLQVRSLKRSYIVCVPTNTTGPMPVVMAFHGSLMNAWLMQLSTNWHYTFARQGMITVYANACSRTSCDGGVWNAEAPLPSANWAERQRIDDKGYVLAVLDAVDREYGVDRSRVYAGGVSNGGAFAYSLACDLPETFAGVGVVAGALTDASCAPGQSVAVFHLHGTADTVVPFSKSSLTGLPPAEDAIAFWAANNGCGPEVETTIEDEFVVCQHYRGCNPRGDVEWCLVKDAGHFSMPVQLWPVLVSRMTATVLATSK